MSVSICGRGGGETTAATVLGEGGRVMGAGGAPYEPYHPHLGYTLALTGLAWLLVVGYSWMALRAAPRARVMLYGLAIMLPIVAELSALVVYLLRPSPDTHLGALLSHIHLAYLQPLPLDSYLAPALLAAILGLLAVLMLASLVRFAIGTWRLRDLLRHCNGLAEAGYPALHARMQLLARTHKFAPPTMAVMPVAEPLAFTTGLLRPRIYISTALLALLTEDEVVAVLCHELAHAVRRDNVWNWLVRLFRDMCWFLPVGFVGWRWMVVSQDEDCDALAARLTRDPLTLARALLKVAAAWHHQSGTPLLSATSFASSPDVRARVEQMLALSDGQTPVRRSALVGAVLLAATLLLLGPLPALLGS